MRPVQGFAPIHQSGGQARAQATDLLPGGKPVGKGKPATEAEFGSDLLQAMFMQRSSPADLRTENTENYEEPNIQSDLGDTATKNAEKQGVSAGATEFSNPKLEMNVADSLKVPTDLRPELGTQKFLSQPKSASSNSAPQFEFPVELNSTSAIMLSPSLIAKLHLNAEGKTPVAGKSGLNFESGSSRKISPEVSPDIVSNPLLRQGQSGQIQQLSSGFDPGMIQVVSVQPEFQEALPSESEDVTESDFSAPRGKEKPMSMQNRLSGNDFVNTLNSVKTGSVESKRSILKDSANPASDPLSQFGRSLSGTGSRTSQKELQGKRPSVGGFENRLENLALNGFGNGITTTGPQNAPAVRADLSAQVVPSGLGKERFSTDSFIRLSDGIKGLAGQSQGGEIRVRLSPENLGGMSIRVLTVGGKVDLQIHAATDRARKVIEDSLSVLKETLAGHQLTLGQVEVAVSGSNPSASFSHNEAQAQTPDQRQDSQQQSSSGFSFLQEQTGRDSQQGRQGNSARYSGDAEQNAVLRPLSVTPYRKAVSQGRVDLHA